MSYLSRNGLVVVLAWFVLGALWTGPIRAQEKLTELEKRIAEVSGRAAYIEQVAIENGKRLEQARRNTTGELTMEEFYESNRKHMERRVQIDMSYGISKARATQREVQIKYDQLQSARHDANQWLEKAKNARTNTLRDYYLKQAERKAEQAGRLTNEFLGPPRPLPPQTPSATRPTTPAPTQPAPATGQTTPPQAAGQPKERFVAPLFKVREEFDIWRDRSTKEADPEQAQQRAQEEVGPGRAGAGGVSLHKAAEPENNLDLADVQLAEVQDGRLVLVSKKAKLVLPPVDLDHLAVAMRAVHGGLGVVEGKLIADDEHCIVVETSKEQYGEVVWGKHCLPATWRSAPIGSTVRPILGPGVGLLSLPEPSKDRVTYYGPIKNTKMGETLLRADQLLSLLSTGVDGHTGQPAPLPKIAGFQSSTERRVRSEFDGSANKRREQLKAKRESQAEQDRKWWQEAGWYVWMPQRFTFRRNANGDSCQWVETKMMLSTWSADPDNVDPPMQKFGEDVTKHYDQLAEAYPCLRELVEVTKAVSLVRWLNRENIAVDLDWAVSRKVTSGETPDVDLDYTVWLIYEDGKPKVDKHSDSEDIGN